MLNDIFGLILKNKEPAFSSDSFKNMEKGALTGGGRLVAVEPHHQREFPLDDAELDLGVVEGRLGLDEGFLGGVERLFELGLDLIGDDVALGLDIDDVLALLEELREHILGAGHLGLGLGELLLVLLVERVRPLVDVEAEHATVEVAGEGTPVPTLADRDRDLASAAVGLLAERRDGVVDRHDCLLRPRR